MTLVRQLGNVEPCVAAGEKTLQQAATAVPKPMQRLNNTDHGDRRVADRAVTVEYERIPPTGIGFARPIRISNGQYKIGPNA